MNYFEMETEMKNFKYNPKDHSPLITHVLSYILPSGDSITGKWRYWTNDSGHICAYAIYNCVSEAGAHVDTGNVSIRFRPYEIMSQAAPTFKGTTAYQLGRRPEP